MNQEFGPRESAEEDELWLVSYADLLTLLLAFFVLILASSRVAGARFERIASSLRGTQTAPLEELRSQVDSLIRNRSLEDSVRTRSGPEGLEMEFTGSLLFRSGSSQVQPEGVRVVSSVAQLVRSLPGRAVVIEGHSDDVPVRGGGPGSNWELSAQRALNVLHALEDNGVERTRLSVRSFADTRAVQTEGTLEERRARNRRVVIRVE